MDKDEKDGLRWVLRNALSDLNANKISDWYIESETRTVKNGEEKEVILRLVYPLINGEEKHD